MNLKINFTETNQDFQVKFGELHILSQGGYEEGYNDGYSDGEKDGYEHGYEYGEKDGYDRGYDVGHKDGLNERTYETWTITLVDGTIVEKEISLL